MNIYLSLTEEFNEGRPRAVITSGQAVVLYRLAIMSKDGDWILRENDEDLLHILSVLASHGATYRFGAPLDIRWLRHGWSSHLQFQHEGLRIRTDFFTRPPRIDRDVIEAMWGNFPDTGPPVVDLCSLAETKKTNREKDYAVIGELARLMPGIDEQILYSRSARDLMQLAEEYPDKVEALSTGRPVLTLIQSGRDALETGLDQERRQLMRKNEARLERYAGLAAGWGEAWLDVSREAEGLPLLQAHETIVERAEDLLPFGE